ncbi:MAG: TolC family protein [Ginsengibacter sp.]
MNKLTVWLSRGFVTILLFPVFDFALYGQKADTLSIEKAYTLARKNYPLIKQRDLITKTTDFTVSNAAKGYLPSFSVKGQATYQSTVTDFPFNVPGIHIPQFNKDQYKMYAEADQIIYDGGVIQNKKKSATANGTLEQQNLEVQLYALYERVSQLFFGALLMEEQLNQNHLLQKDIQNGIEKAEALVANGVAYRSSVDELSAQLLQAQQSNVEISTSKKAYLEMLKLFTGLEQDTALALEKPVGPSLKETINRPELQAFEFQKKIYDLRGSLLKDQIKPRVSFFVQGGYGRPGLNFLSNNFEWYYIGGVRFSWDFGSLYSLKNNLHLLEINRNSLETQKEVFLFNTKISQLQQKEIVQKFDSLIQKDNSIIELRSSVKKAAFAQLENGVLSAHDYINQVIAEDQARQNKIIHEVQLLQAQYSYQNITGNINNR